MTGLIYKEFKQNKILLLLTVLIPFIVFALPLFLQFSMEETDSGRNNQILFVLAALAGYIALAQIQSLTFKGDDTKIWGYFTASNPEGIKGYLYIKYMMILGMGLFFSFCMGAAEMVSNAIYESICHEPFLSMNPLYIILFFVQLIFMAIDIPFIVRFGVRMGSIIKIIGMIALVLIFSMVLVLSPDAVMNMFHFIEAVLFSKDSGFILTSIFPYLSFVLFYLSYQISCAIYMKGVENCAK